MTLTAIGTVAFLALAACSKPPVTDASGWPPRDDQASNDPPGAALPLSIGGQIKAEGGGALSTAVHCAAALGLTAQRLSSVTDNPLSAEIALMGRAEEFFIARANEAALQTRSVSDAVARRREEKASEITEQAQLAIACLRRFGASVADSSADQTAPFS